MDRVHNLNYNNISDLFTVGAGQVNITAALASSDSVTVPAISPLAVMNSNGQVTLMFAENIVWGTNMVWGTNVVWGTNMVWGTNIVWGTTVLTGQSLNGLSVLWAGTGAAWVNASNIVWGTATLPASSIACVRRGRRRPIGACLYFAQTEVKMPD